MENDTATAQTTLETMLRKSRREHLPLRRPFVQGGPQNKPIPGPLARFVRAHDELGFDLCLLSRAVASAAPFEANYDSGVWARALNLTGKTAKSKVSRGWNRLEDAKLISRKRKGRKASITALREDGSGSPYVALTGSATDPYFKLSIAYWLDGWYTRLSLAAKAVLLIALTQKDGFELPSEKASRWYGLSAHTIEKGLFELRDASLLVATTSRRPAPLTGPGYTTVRRYHLRPPFRKPRTAMAKTA